eukprot:IDg21045t1
MYVAIGCNPENGCKYRKLLAVAGTSVPCKFLRPWAGSSYAVCADSYFVSVEASVTMDSMGMRFIGIVKTAFRKFPMPELTCRHARNLEFPFLWWP